MSTQKKGYVPIPVRFRVSIQSWEHDREDSRKVVAHEVDNVFVIPVQERPFCDLEVLTVDAPCELLEQGDLNLLELDGIRNVQNLLDLIQEHDFLRRVHLWPILEQSHHHLLRKRGILFQELHHTVRQLRVI
jgi:hypothetical protein